MKSFAVTLRLQESIKKAFLYFHVCLLNVRKDIVSYDYLLSEKEFSISLNTLIQKHITIKPTGRNKDE